MCSSHANAAMLSRRGFTTMAMAGAGLGLLPFGARAAAPCEALCITCIDYRAIDSTVRFLQTAQPDGLNLPRDFDIVALAGASLASVSTKFPGSVDALWNHVSLAKSLHKIKRVIVIDHRDCGAFEVEFGRKPKDDCEEYNWHCEIMQKMHAQFIERGWMAPPPGPALSLDFYLMPKPGEDSVPRRLPLPYFKPALVDINRMCRKAA